MKLILALTLATSTSSFTVPGISRTTHHELKTSSQNTRFSLSLQSTDNDLDVEKLGLTPQLATMTKAFASIPDEKLRYKQLLYMANQLKPIDPSLMVAENKVPGCLSTVFVDCEAETKMNEETGVEETVLNYVGESDGLLTKGLVALLVRGLSGCTPEQIQKVDPEFINAAKISQSLTPGRNNGFLNMLAVMKKKASEVATAGDETAKPSESDEVEAVEESSIVTSFEEIDGKPMYNAMMGTLISVIKPVMIEIVDNSDQHAGHAGSKGWEESGESHFSLTIVADAFSGLPLVKRHQLIYMILGDVMNKIHALQINAKSPDEVDM